jgi:hypothetical protein
VVTVGLRYNPPPGWPPAPPGFTPPPGWQPDPSWPAPPPGWQLWVNDDQLPTGSLPSRPPWETQTPQSSASTVPPLSPYDTGNTGPAAGPAAYGGGGYGNPGSPYGPGANANFTDTGTSNYVDAGSPNYGGARYSDAPGRHSATPGAYDGASGQYAGPPGQSGAYAGTPGPYTGQPGQPGQPDAYPSYPNYPGANQYGPSVPPGSGNMSGWAIASFVLGMLGGFVLSVIFGFIALSRIKRLGQRGRGFAIAGLVLSVVWLLGFIAIAVVGSHGQASRSPSSGNITHSGRLSVFSLAVGDCFNNPAGASTVTTVTAIPCSQRHNAQIYAKFNLTGSDLSYPGNRAVTKLAEKGCNARTDSINKSAAPSSMTIRLLFPEQDAWLNGRRTVACMIVNPTADITSSLVNS